MEQAIQIHDDRFDGLKEYAKVGKDFLNKFFRTIEYRITTIDAMVPTHVLNGEECPHKKVREDKWMYYCERHNAFLERYKKADNEFVKKEIEKELESLHKKILYYQDEYAYCRDNCSYTKVPDGVSVPEKAVIYRETSSIISARLSKLQIKQLLLYHFMSVDNNGFLTHVSEQDIADILGCHLRSVRMNNEFFEQLGLVVTSRTGISPYSINIYIPDFQHYKKEKDEGGRGYLYIKKNFFIQLLAMENVNMIRQALFMLLKHDNDTVKEIFGKKEKNSDTVVALKEFKRVVPQYLRGEQKLINTINKLPNIFEKSISMNTVQFKLKEDFNSKVMRPEEMESYISHFQEMIRTVKFGLVEIKVFHDLAQLAFEYSFERVKEAFQYVIDMYIDPDNREFGRKAYNIGAMVRTIIRKNIRNQKKIG